METIRSYLDNMFARLPMNGRLQAVKADLLQNMEEKYNELKAAGRSENEAVGIVISEFGNIEELLEEMGLSSVYPPSAPVPVSMPSPPPAAVLPAGEAEAYLRLQTRSAGLCAVATALCILAPAVMLLLMQLFLLSGTAPPSDSPEETRLALLAMVPLLVLIALGVALFILASLPLEKFKNLKKGGFILDAVTEGDIRRRAEKLQPAYAASLVAGTVLCILAPVALFLVIAIDENLALYGVCLLLALVAAGTFLFVRFGILHEGYAILLREKDFSSGEDAKASRIFSAVIWPLAVIVFLLWGFLGNGWKIAWIVFPVAALLHAIVARVCDEVNEGK